MVGELDAGKPHVQFDEGAQETCDSATRLCPTLPEPLASQFFHALGPLVIWTEGFGQQRACAARWSAT
jgi:hypothetical protein